MDRVNAQAPMCLCEECRRKIGELYILDESGYIGRCTNHSDRGGREYYVRRKGTAQYVDVAAPSRREAGRRHEYGARWKEPWREAE